MTAYMIMNFINYIQAYFNNFLGEKPTCMSAISTLILKKKTIKIKIQARERETRLAIE